MLDDRDLINVCMIRMTYRVYVQPYKNQDIYNQFLTLKRRGMDKWEIIKRLEVTESLYKNFVRKKTKEELYYD